MNMKNMKSEFKTKYCSWWRKCFLKKYPYVNESYIMTRSNWTIIINYNNVFWKLTKLQFLLAWLCSLVLAKEKPNIVLVVADDLGYRNGLLFSFGSWAQIFIWQVIFRLEFTYTGNLPAVNYTSLRLAL